MSYVKIQELKFHLNIEDSFVSDDTYLNQLINVAEASIKNYCNGGLSTYTGSTCPVEIREAVLLLASHLYINRQPIAFGQPYKIPYTFEFLLSPYKNYSIA